VGLSNEYSQVPDWVEKPSGYQTGEMVKYEGNVFIAAFWADKPGEGEPDRNGWRLHDELYDVTSSPATEPAKIIGYIPTWRKKEEFDYTNVEMYRHVTHGIISFLMFSETDLGEFESKSVEDVNAILNDVLLTGHVCGTHISIALGGAVDYGFLYLMERIGKNPDDPVLEKAVKNVVDFVKSKGLDGVDLDLECWWDKNNDQNKDQGGRLKSDGPHPAGKGLTQFAKKLKQAMPDKIISAALFATSWYGNCYDPELVEYVDWLGLMTYDLTGSWNQSPVGPQTALIKIRKQEEYAAEQQGEWPGNRKSSANATDPMSDNPILSVEDSLWYWTNPFFTNWQGKGQNLKRNKIAAGVPIYGYDFAYGKVADDLSGQLPPGYKTIRYKDIFTQFPDAHTAENANIKVAGTVPTPPFISAPGVYRYAHNIYFETPKTATEKLNFLKRVGAQGVIIWELSNDVWEGGKSVIQALYQNSGNPETRLALPPSNGKPSVPSDILALYIERIINHTNKFADEVERGQEKETSQLGLLVEPSLEEAIAKFFKDAGKKDGKEIKIEDANSFTQQWTKIEEQARNYDSNSPEAARIIADVKDKVDRLVAEVESKIDEDEDDGWLFVPFYSLIAFFKTYTLLEWFVRENPPPVPDPEPDSDPDPKPGSGPVPVPKPGPIPKPDPGSGPVPQPPSPVPVPDPGLEPLPDPSPSPSPSPEPENPENDENEQKECERQADEVSQQIQQSIDVLTDARDKWPKMDLGPIDSVLGSPISPPPPPPVEPPPPPPPVEPPPPPPPAEHSYEVQVIMSATAVVTTTEIFFFLPSDRTKVFTFNGTAASIPGLSDNEWEATAKLNYEIEWLVDQEWEATYDFTYGPTGLNLNLHGLSGEDIGSVTASTSFSFILPGGGGGRGGFGSSRITQDPPDPGMIIPP
jgi:GH18 family chitinase